MTISISSDRELIAAHLQGSAPAFDELFRRYQGRLWAVAVRMLSNPADAEDAVQEAFLAALRSRSFRGEAEVGTWLHRIVVNKCTDRIRSARRQPAPDPGGVPVDGPAAGPDPGTAVATRLAVQDAIALLAPEQRAAVVLVNLLDNAARHAPPGTDVALGLSLIHI